MLWLLVFVGKRSIFFSNNSATEALASHGDRLLTVTLKIDHLLAIIIILFILLFFIRLSACFFVCRRLRYASACVACQILHSNFEGTLLSVDDDKDGADGDSEGLFMIIKDSAGANEVRGRFLSINGFNFFF